MALTYTEAQSVSTDLYDSVIKQQIYTKSPFLTKLQKNKDFVADGGNNYRWTIRYQTLGKANAVDPEAEFVFEKKSTRTTAILAPAFYKAETMLTWKERNSNMGKPKVIDLIGDKSEELVQDMANRFATDLYTTNPNGLGIVSLPVIVDAADTYAGIAVSDAAAWAADEDSTTTELTLYGSGSLAEAIDDTILGTEFANFHLTNPDLFHKFVSLIEPQKRYPDKDMADAGFQNVSFEGNPVFPDTHCPAGYWYGLCMNKGVWKLYHHPDDNFAVSKWESLAPDYPKNLGKYVTFEGNLICKCRKVNFKFSALDYTI